MLAFAAWSLPAHANLLFTFAGDCSTTTCFGSTYTLKIGDAGDAMSSTYDAQLLTDTTPIAFGHIGASYNNEAGTANGENTSISNGSTIAVPEASTLLLIGIGLVALAGITRRFSGK